MPTEVLITAAFAGIGLLFILFFRGNNSIRDLSERIVKLETSNELLKVTWSMLEKAVMAAMHSPTDHLGLDALIDEYHSRSYDLPQSKWEQMHDKCELLLENPQRVGDDKALALLGLFLSTHKLAQYGVVRTQGVNQTIETKTKGNI